MKQSGPLKHFIYPFFIAVAIYLVSYSGIEHLRTRHGPWQVTFTNELSIPALVINEPQLNIANLSITFPGQSAQMTNATMSFAQPQEVPFDVPFGQCVFEDTTFQPGTIAFKLFGHEIQLLPRVLTIDKKEYPWQSNTTMPLAPVH
jgi:hypothetical protein